jgi:hypothetical protein
MHSRACQTYQSLIPTKYFYEFHKYENRYSTSEHDNIEPAPKSMTNTIYPIIILNYTCHAIANHSPPKEIHDQAVFESWQDSSAEKCAVRLKGAPLFLGPRGNLRYPASLSQAVDILDYSGNQKKNRHLQMPYGL